MPSVALRYNYQHQNQATAKPKDTAKLLGVNRLHSAVTLCLDLLEYIFLLGVNLESEPYNRRRTALSYAQTCHDWRVAALSMKSLWGPLSDFDFMPWAWNEEMLHRSFPLPVKMGLCTFPPRNASAVEAELNHLERIRTYRLGFTSDTWNILADKLQPPAEEIEYLSLAHVTLGPQTHSSRVYAPSNTNLERFILPANLFSGQAPQLRRLKLDGCFVDARAPVLSMLTSLVVLDIDTRYNIAPTAAGWISLLSGVPDLTELVLRNAVSSPDSVLRPGRRRSSAAGSWSPTASKHASTAKLAKLAHLHFDGPLKEASALLAALEVPAGCDMTIVCRNCEIGDELDVVQRVWAKALGGALGARDGKFPRPTRSLEHVEANSKNAPFPLLISASGPLLTLSTDSRVNRHAISTLADASLSLSYPFTTPSSRSIPIPNFYLDLHSRHGESWELLLTPLLSTLCDHSLFESDSANESNHMYGPLVSRITSLEVILPSPHLDLVPFLAQADQVEALVNVPGYAGGWLVEELRIRSTRIQEEDQNRLVGEEHGGSANHGSISTIGVERGASRGEYSRSNPDNTRSRSTREPPFLPRLQAMSFTDDRCLYGSSWVSLEGLLKSRMNPAKSPSPADRALESVDAILASRSHSAIQTSIQRVAFRRCLVPDDKIEALKALVPTVECEVLRFGHNQSTSRHSTGPGGPWVPRRWNQ